MRNRDKQRELKRKQREESLDKRNSAGYLDLTAFSAVARIRNEAKSSTRQTLKEMK
ncbi:MAG: hypothetical protein ACYCVD_18340 [Desulfitobacteriaceae bacterium]